jgi:sugar lactone lactonase YvrE
VVSAAVIALGGLAFPEALRWRDDRLYFSDVFGRYVATLEADGVMTVLNRTPDLPSGLGWRPDSSMLVVQMRERVVRTFAPAGGAGPTIDLGPSTIGMCNDMVLDRKGRAYVGHFGFDYVGGQERRPATLVCIDPDNSVRTVAHGLESPNGMVITADGATLLVAETHGRRITSFTVDADGALSGRATFAQFEDIRPDGICLDADGAVWLASPATGHVVRVAAGGRVLERFEVAGGPSCCVLGGRTLYVSCGPTHDEVQARALRPGHILAFEVDVPGG